MTDTQQKDLTDQLLDYFSDQKNVDRIAEQVLTISMAFIGRRYVRKGLEAVGVEHDKAKTLSRAIPWLAYVVGSNTRLGVIRAGRMQEAIDGD